jgi:endogenous inhibitor of DNA gyrase (YacG/DUF329 family)
MEIVTCPNCGKKTPKGIEIISYTFIIESFKKGTWKNVENFEDMLEFYFDSKRRVLENVKIVDMNRWLAQVIIALEIAKMINPERFGKIYEDWKKLIGRNWFVDVEREVVTWID